MKGNLSLAIIYLTCIIASIYGGIVILDLSFNSYNSYSYSHF